MSVESALSDILNNVPDCIATGWVDVHTGRLLEVETAGPPEAASELVATATTEVFQGTNVAAIVPTGEDPRPAGIAVGVPTPRDLASPIEDMFQRVLGDATAGHYFREIIVMSQNLIYMFARCRTSEDQVLVVITRISTNLGALITRTRAALSAREAAA